MNTDFLIPAETIAAYLATCYRIEPMGEDSIELRIGVHSDSLLLLHDRFNVLSSVFVTACNPFGAVGTAGFNALAMRQLESWLDSRSIAWLRGSGHGNDGSWPPEPSVLALGIGIHCGQQMCVAFRQNSIVSIGADGVPQLTLHPAALVESASIDN